MASNVNAETAARDPNDITSILAVDETTQDKTTKLMTSTRDGINYLKVDTELKLSTDSLEIVNNLDIATYTSTFAYDVNGDIEYVGDSAPGTAKGDTDWRIKKLVYNAGDVIDVQWAGGVNTFTMEWDERSGYSYS